MTGDLNVACVILTLLKLSINSNGESKPLNAAVTRSHCPEGKFECSVNSTLCIPQSLNCNGKPDCPDGSDERNCTDELNSNLWDLMFQKRPDEDAEQLTDECLYEDVETGIPLIYQKSVDLDKPLDELAEIIDIPEERATTEHFEGCICSRHKLFCHNLKLEDLKRIPDSVQFLDLTGSRINNMDFDSKNFSSLSTLILSNCYVEKVGEAAFQALTVLHTLHLTSNYLREINNHTFLGCKNLRKLSLRYNAIEKLYHESFTGLGFLQELDLRNNALDGNEQNPFQSLTRLKILHLSENNIETLKSNYLHGLVALEVLSLSFNEMWSIEPASFIENQNLKHLYLNGNNLQVIEPNTFCPLTKLLHLTLRDNELVEITQGAFNCLKSLQSLNLEHNGFGELEKAKGIFKSLRSLQHIYFDQFWMCWWAPHVRSCQPKGDGISSVKNLLDNVILRVSVWVVGTVGLLGNIFVIVSRIVIREPNPVHSFYIRNLAGADLLMSIFLISIAIHDVRFRGEFLSHQHAWRHSITCQVSGILSTLSSESSVLILIVITLDRYSSIVHPLNKKELSLLSGYAICLIIWILGIILSVLPLSGIFPNYFGENFYTGNGLCLPLHIHNPYDPAWEYSFMLFVGLNSLGFLFICYAYAKMLRIIQTSALMLRSNQEKQDSLLTKRFALIVVTDFLCWAPIITSKVLAMSGVEIPVDLYAWLAVFVLPVNSALNPVIYTLTTKLFKQQMIRSIRNARRRLTQRRISRSFDGSFSTSFSYLRNRVPKTDPCTLNPGNGNRSSSKRLVVYKSRSSLNRGNNNVVTETIPMDNLDYDSSHLEENRICHDFV